MSCFLCCICIISLYFIACVQKQKTGGRTKVLLDNVPVHKLADIFVASFEISFEEQLSMLDSVDPKVRLSKATELVDRHLQVNNGVDDAWYGSGILSSVSNPICVCLLSIVNTCSWENHTKGWRTIVKISKRISFAPAGKLFHTIFLIYLSNVNARV